MFELPVKFHLMFDDVCVPKYGSERAIGIDLRAYITRCDSAYRDFTLMPGRRHVFGTGLRIAIEDEGWYARIAPRSGLAVKHGIDVLAGVVDADYRGELMVCLINHGEYPFVVNNGDRIAQLIFESADRACIELVTAQGIGTTARGTGGFGSTGLN